MDLDLLLQTTLLLILVIDPLGNVPLFASIIRNVPHKRQTRVILRDLVIALLVMLAVLMGGRTLMAYLGLSQAAIGIAGGIVLFLIAIRLVFPPANDEEYAAGTGEPFIVPLAVPLVAGPSAMATLMLLSGRSPDQLPTLALATLLAWAVSAPVMLAAPFLARFVGTRILKASTCLIGMLLVAVAAQQFLDGLQIAIAKMR